MISVHGLSKSFGKVQAVRDVSFEIPRGQVAGLLGTNGAGKTTTIRMITGFFPPDAGSVSVSGHDLLESSMPARRTLGYLPESAPAYTEMKTADFLHYRGKLFSMRRKARTQAIAKVLAQCSLEKVRNRRIGHLSKGYRQRVGLAAALLHEPDVLILDEPTNGLDPTQIRQVRSLIRHLAKERTVLVSSHILPEVELMCDRVVIMAQGRVRADGSPQTLLKPLQASSKYIAEIWVQSIRSPGGVVAFLSSVPGVESARLLNVSDKTTDPGWARCEITPEKTAGDLRAPIASTALNAGVLIRQLGRDEPTLERLFLSIIESDANPTAAVPGVNEGGA